MCNHYLFNHMRISICVITVLFVTACNNQPVKAPGDTLKTGQIHISVDESFKPVIDSQIKVFESNNPGADIVPHYKAESECLKDLLNDSIRMVIVTRGLLPSEQQMMEDTLKFRPRFSKVALDAVTVLVHKQCKDSIFDMADLRGILNGTSGYKLKPVMDGTSATSTVRYAIDSILGGQKLAANVVAARSSEGVIDYVSQNPDALGFVGVSWIGNKRDSTQLSFQDKVTIASIECLKCDRTTYVKPYQANIAMRRYPLVRGLYYILKENYDGLGSGFVNFLIYEKGQLNFQKAFLWPTQMSFEVRGADMKE
jgi:phosphate transport system substrate-binding protein